MTILSLASFSNYVVSSYSGVLFFMQQLQETKKDFVQIWNNADHV